MPKFIDLMDRRFDKLLVIKYIGKDKRGQSLWLCKCDCGKEKVVRGSSLTNGHTRSCGCLQRERASSTMKFNFTKHGYYGTPTYSTWHDMKTRCLNPNDKQYKNYGARKIKICKRWMKFENFLEDMGEKPEGLTLERINNNLGYYKANCKWATQKEQQRNKRNNKLYYYKGKSQILIDWSVEYKINYKTLKSRIQTYGWSMEKALTTPIRKRKRKTDYVNS